MSWTADQIRARCQERGFSLPEAPKPVASYVPARTAGHELFVSGQVPLADGSLMATGPVPSAVPPETAAACARQCAINAVAVICDAIGPSGAVDGIVRVGVWVASDPGWGGQPQVANGASDLLVEIFGDDGRHARAAVGPAALPLNVPVEVEVLARVSGLG